jgi:hypothetical protein
VYGWWQGKESRPRWTGTVDPEGRRVAQNSSVGFGIETTIACDGGKINDAIYFTAGRAKREMTNEAEENKKTLIDVLKDVSLFIVEFEVQMSSPPVHLQVAEEQKPYPAPAKACGEVIKEDIRLKTTRRGNMWTDVGGSPREPEQKFRETKT